jgi:hypothetical protein
MTDLRTRFRALDDLRAPDLWNEIEERAMAAEPRRTGTSRWVLIAVVALLLIAMAGIALVGSGIIRLPVLLEASLVPSASADASPDASTDESTTPSGTAIASAEASATPAEPTPASWTATGSMALARADHTATLLSDGTVLVVGSVFLADGPPPSAATELYDPRTGTWTTTGDMIEGRLGHAATRLGDGRVLVTGGGGSAELYDPISGTWAATGDMIEPFGIATLLLDGTVLVAGSGDTGVFAQLYDPASGTWTATGTMIEAADGAAPAATATRLLDGRVLVMDGGGGSAQLYDPSSRTWTATGNMIDPRSWNTATLLPDGTVLVAGGLDSTGTGGDEVVFVVASAELYDPVSGTWSTTASMSEARQGHRATALADGRVLVTGGGVASVELYDPASGAWSTTASMVQGRDAHTTTLLEDGRVLAVGGNDVSGALTSAELYSPGGNP